MYTLSKHASLKSSTAGHNAAAFVDLVVYCAASALGKACMEEPQSFVWPALSVLVGHAETGACLKRLFLKLLLRSVSGFLGAPS